MFVLVLHLYTIQWRVNSEISFPVKIYFISDTLKLNSFIQNPAMLSTNCSIAGNLICNFKPGDLLGNGDLGIQCVCETSAVSMVERKPELCNS